MGKQSILFFDVDGTLFDCANGMPHISEQLKEAFKQLRQQGHLCFIASGRSHAYLNDEIKNLGFDGFVICNGAIVLKGQETLITHYVPKANLKQLVEQFDKHQMTYCFNDTYEAYCPKKFKTMLEMLENFAVPMEQVITEFDLEDIKVAKIEAYANERKAKDFLLSLRNCGYEVLDYADSGYYEISVANVSKGKSIVELLKVLNIPVENSIAFGDGENDMEMLQVVGHGVAMGNAYEPLKKVADIVTEPCVEHGIVKELQRLGLVKGII